MEVLNALCYKEVSQDNNLITITAGNVIAKLTKEELTLIAVSEDKVQHSISYPRCQHIDFYQIAEKAYAFLYKYTGDANFIPNMLLTIIRFTARPLDKFVTIADKNVSEMVEDTDVFRYLGEYVDDVDPTKVYSELADYIKGLNLKDNIPIVRAFMLCLLAIYNTFEFGAKAAKPGEVKPLKTFN